MVLSKWKIVEIWAIFFEYNNEFALLSAIKDSEKNNKDMLLEALKYAKKFSVFSHCKNFEKILNETIN